MVNPRFEEISGRTKHELAKIYWTDYTHPDDVEKEKELFDKYINGEINGYSINKRYIKPNGSIVWVNMTLTPITVGSWHDIDHVCAIEDITERIQTEMDFRESERSKSVMLSNLPGMAYRCNYDKDWTMQFVSDGCYELTGYKPENLLYNKDLTFNELIAPEYRKHLWNKWTEILPKGGVLKEEYAITTASGEIKWVYEQGRGIYDENGEVIALEGLIIDITDRKKKEDEIRYLNFHDVLTGLYNRRFFEKEIKALDIESNLPLSIIVGDINGLKVINDTLGRDHGDQLIKSVANILKSCVREKDVLARTGGDDFCILLPQTSNEEAYEIMKNIEKTYDEYKSKANYHTNVSLGCATKTIKSEDFSTVIKSAEDKMYRSKLLQSQSLHSTIISSMKVTLYEKSQETEEHASRLIKLSRAVGQKMKLKDEQLNELELLCTLHDIGKIGISDVILNKPGKLTAEEWEVMKTHPEIGYRIAMSTPELSAIAPYILHHHERYDGKGYPEGLKGKEIPLLSRILAVVDAYDAMTEDRPYRKAMSKDEAILEIKKNSGTQIDPNIAEIFINIITQQDPSNNLK